ncbi:MAG: DNA recombination protein RmuC [Rhodobiaceae bacterium]|nr:DNA recombination protein RmuC [Rhodobiaceae bacterium]MCC0055116.1 DNA recombination protein RmuC [Rhodobiaceae bacterium]
MQEIILTIGGRALTAGELVLAGGCLALALLLAIAIVLIAGQRGRHREQEEDVRRAVEADRQMAELMRAQAEMTGRMQTMAEVFGNRHADLARALSERIDSFGQRLHSNLSASTQATHDNLSKLNERLAVIDKAQSNITELSKEVVSLQDILSNKQARGAFGQGRMEAIVADGLPQGRYRFQATLSNGKMPDCLIDFADNAPPLVIDAKFPLEAVTAFREARDGDTRKHAMARMRTDVGKHIGDITDRYFIPGETQDIAIMFVPSESLYADLNEYFEDIIQKAHRARVIIVGPSMLMLAIQVMQSILRDQKMREQAHIIHREVGMLSDDVRRLSERVEKLKTHFGQAGKDIDDILISTDKIVKRGGRLRELDFEDANAQPQLLAGE